MGGTQCRGDSLDGIQHDWEKCCREGTTCVYMNEGWSECKTEAQQELEEQQKLNEVPADSQADACLPAGTQCQGDSLDGKLQDWEKCCREGTTCVYMNKGWSEVNSLAEGMELGCSRLSLRFASFVPGFTYASFACARCDNSG